MQRVSACLLAQCTCADGRVHGCHTPHRMSTAAACHMLEVRFMQWRCSHSARMLLLDNSQVRYTCKCSGPRHYTIKFFRWSFSYYYSPCRYMKAWIHILHVPTELLCTRCSDTRAEPEKVCTTRLRIGQNCRAVYTKKSGPDCTEAYCRHNITRSGDIGINRELSVSLWQT